jgi:hypothetical protein
MIVIDILSIIVLALILPFFAYLGLIAVAALSDVGRGRAGAPSRLPRFLVVIPAHDEETNIQSTVESCRAISYDPSLFHVLVIADNCIDGTAQAARAAGAEVIERADPVRRSKGHALEYFFEQNPSTVAAFEAVVLVDADTLVDPEILTAFAGAIAQGKDWVQCYYTVRNPDLTWRTRMMTYAFSLYNGVWLLGQDRLGLGVSLKGNGMCFSTRGLARFPWRAHGLTEDLEFSWRLRIAGERIHFLPGTRVQGAMPGRGGSAAAAQRQRWEAGRKTQRDLFLGPLLRSHRIGPLTKFLYAMDLVFPPLVTLLIYLLVAIALQLGASLDAGHLETVHWLLPVHLMIAGVLSTYAFSPFVTMGLPVRYLTSLAALPYYAIWKVIMTTGRRPTTWVRTSREPAPVDALV